MAAKMIVLVADRDDPRHGEITILQDSPEAERLVETLLEAGFEQERIRIFSGLEMDMKVSQRPVVSLVGEEPQASPSFEDQPPEEEAEPEESARSAESESEEQTAATAYVQNGVRFSSLFRGA